MILELCEDLEPVLGKPTARSHALPVHTQVLIGLRFMASASFQNVLGNVAGVSQSACSRVLKPFCEAVVVWARDNIRFPLGDDGFIARIKAGKSEQTLNGS